MIVGLELMRLSGSIEAALRWMNLAQPGNIGPGAGVAN
jgi:hypothetical protein